MAWATPAQARAFWPDAVPLPDPDLSVLLDVATTTLTEYAPALTRLVDATLTQGSTSAPAAGTSSWSQADVGGEVVGGSGITAGTTIVSVDYLGVATLSQAATATLPVSSLGVTRDVPQNYMLATVMQAREVWAAAQRDEQDVISVGDYAIRARPLTAAVKQLLRPQSGVPVVG